MQTSRGKFVNLRRTPAEFTALDFVGYGLCCLSPARPASTASYSVSAPSTEFTLSVAERAQGRLSHGFATRFLGTPPHGNDLAHR